MELDWVGRVSSDAMLGPPGPHCVLEAMPAPTLPRPPFLADDVLSLAVSGPLLPTARQADGHLRSSPGRQILGPDPRKRGPGLAASPPLLVSLGSQFCQEAFFEASAFWSTAALCPNDVAQ